MINLNGVPIQISKLLSPDFYIITNWEKPWQDPKPEWQQIWFIDGRIIVHPTVFEKLKASTPRYTSPDLKGFPRFFIGDQL